MTDRKKPGVAFWATVVVVAALVAYPLSLGPALWMENRGLLQSDYLTVYGPLEGLGMQFGWFGAVLRSYASLWVT
jgi:hypothetical protein